MPDSAPTLRAGTCSPDWLEDCMNEHGRYLLGAWSHWCPDWDFMPIDETCESEFAHCTCYDHGHGPPVSADEETSSDEMGD